MRIGIDVSQLAYENTGVASYLKNLIENLLKIDKKNNYVLFFSSMRRKFQFSIFNFQSEPKNLEIKIFKIPPFLLNILWNRLHILPIEYFIGNVDVFITSDWTEPPARLAKKATIIYDLIVYKYPKETDRKIIQTQKRKLNWVKKESDIIFCISESSKKDIIEILKIPKNKIKVIYPGVSN